MNVGIATGLFSQSVSDGLKYLVEEEGYSKEMLTTAKFIEVVARWFELVNSRRHVVALSKSNMVEYNKAIENLEDVKKLFLEMYVIIFIILHQFLFTFTLRFYSFQQHW